MLKCTTAWMLETEEAVRETLPHKMACLDELADLPDVDLTTGGGIDEHSQPAPYIVHSRTVSSRRPRPCGVKPL